MSNDKPQIEKESELEVLTQVKREHEIILYNDDVNTFDHVINTLVAYCDHTYEQAEQCAYIVHYSGKCVVNLCSFNCCNKTTFNFSGYVTSHFLLCFENFF